VPILADKVKKALLFLDMASIVWDIHNSNSYVSLSQRGRSLSWAR